MESTIKVFLREELYERVWQTPMHRLAKEFSYSDVGLAKLCEKHNIPRPGLGYWRRIELGQKPERTPLPVVEHPNPYRIEIAVRDPRPVDAKAAAQEAPTVTVSPERVLANRDRSRSRSENFILVLFRVPQQAFRTHHEVSEATLLRALRILDALFAALEAHAMQVLWPKDENGSLQVVCESESICFTLEEILDRRVHAPTDQERHGTSATTGGHRRNGITGRTACCAYRF